MIFSRERQTSCRVRTYSPPFYNQRKLRVRCIRFKQHVIGHVSDFNYIFMTCARAASGLHAALAVKNQYGRSFSRAACVCVCVRACAISCMHITPPRARSIGGIESIAPRAAPPAVLFNGFSRQSDAPSRRPTLFSSLLYFLSRTVCARRESNRDAAFPLTLAAR